ncbi:hypothetical protein GCM10017744_102990 [Streptomyces antimycoticus]|uniref:Uncharacterized protein n=1 Tax=Streptomyces antimycoticus TaxID=68175 RepID=A0A4D4KU10_9ACTN|nr:hypothetical protein [Streptomyces antimycoticus]GDY49333.1 hypothetical protein SANT12839_102150 [Streptomyces antimycoticus]
MSLVPRTVYVVGCDSCGATFHAQGPDEDYELTLPTQQLDPAWAEDMVSRGWIVTSRHLCPFCVQARGDAFIERLELEHTHLPLFDLPVHRPGPGDADPA